MPSQEAQMSSKRPSRRQFLKKGAALAGLAAGAVSSPAKNLFAADTPAAGGEALHAYGERSHFEKDARIGSIAMWPIVPGARRDYGFRSPLQDSHRDHYPGAIAFHHLPRPRTAGHRSARASADD